MKINRFFSSLLFSLFLFILVPVRTFAAGEELCPEGYETLCKIGLDSNSNFIGSVINILIIIAIILSVFFLIWGGIKWITSNGDKGKIEQARTTIMASIVGLIISFIAYFIVSVVVNFFTGDGSLNLPIPKLVSN